MRKITAYLLLLAMLLSMAACGADVDTNNTNNTDVGNTTTDIENPEGNEEETRPMHKLPELNFGGDEFLIAYTDWQGYPLYFFADEETGEVMNDALFDRTVKVEEYLNVDVNQYNSGGLSDVVADVRNAVNADDDVYSLALLHCIEGVSGLVTGGFIYNLDIMPYIDMEADWWNRAQMDVLRLGKNTYYGISDYMIPCPYAVFFNKEMIENNNMENPYQLVYDGKWTLDRFINMAISIAQDLDGNGTITLDDVLGVTASEYSKYVSFMPAADQFLTSPGDDGRVHLAMNNEKTIKIIETILKLVETPGAMYEPQYGVEEDMPKMESGRLLFLLDGITEAEKFRDCDVDVGLVPYPKYDEAQENYISLDWGGMMCVPGSISDPDMVGATLELLSWETANKVIPTYYDITLAGKLSRDEDSRNMMELLFDTIAYEIGGNYFGFSGGFNNLFYTIGNLLTRKSTDFASWYATYEETASITIDKFYEALDKVEN